MDFDTLQARRASLVQGQDNLRRQIDLFMEEIEKRRADLHATGGAIQELDFWLNQMRPTETGEVISLDAILKPASQG